MNTRSNGFFFTLIRARFKRGFQFESSIWRLLLLRGFKNGAPPHVNQAGRPLHGNGQAQANKDGGGGLMFREEQHARADGGCVVRCYVMYVMLSCAHISVRTFSSSHFPGWTTSKGLKLTRGIHNPRDCDSSCREEERNMSVKQSCF